MIHRIITLVITFGSVLAFAFGTFRFAQHRGTAGQIVLLALYGIFVLGICVWFDSYDRRRAG